VIKKSLLAVCVAGLLVMSVSSAVTRSRDDFEEIYNENFLPSSVSEIDEEEYRDIYGDVEYTNSISERAERIGEIEETGPEISELSIGDLWELELFGNSYEIIIDDIGPRGETLSGRGTVKDSDFGFMTLSCLGGKLSTTIELPEKNRQYALRYDGRVGEHHVYQRSLDEIGGLEPIDHGSPYLNHEVEGSNSFTSRDMIDSTDKYQYLSNSESMEMDTSKSDTDTNSDTEIGVMIVYTESAAEWAEDNEGDIENVINEAHERSNVVANNSDIGIDFELVHTAQVDYQERRDDLERLTHSNDGYMEEIHQWRLEYGADLVSLFAEMEYGGQGWLLNEADGRTDSGFSMTSVERASDTYTHIHEMGHNMGAHHHKEQTIQPGPGLYNYSAGWRDTDYKISTVMTYRSGMAFEDGINTTHIPYFSNPEIEHPEYGVRIGDPEDADNARTLRETKEVVSEYSEVSEIEDWKDLHEVREDLGGYYELVNDLDENTEDYDELVDTEEGWEPIGERGYGDYRFLVYSKSFTGYFDGNGYDIKDLYINRSGEDCIGLFGVTDYGAEFMNLGVVDAEIIGGDGNNIASLIGRNNCGKISAAYAEGEVSGNWRVGGLVGYSGGTLLNSYAAVDVVGIDSVGGLVGSIPFLEDGMIENTYSIGEVSGDNDVGGLIGNNYGTVIDSFWNVETSGMDTSDGGTGLTTEEMRNVSTYTDTETEGLEEPWDFVSDPYDDEGDESVWDLDEEINDGYPFLSCGFADLTIDIKGEGSVDINPDLYKFELGMEIELSAIAEENWKFVEWTGDVPEGEEKEDTMIVTMNEDKEITAHFEEKDVLDHIRDISGFTSTLLLLAVVMAVTIYKKKR